MQTLSDDNLPVAFATAGHDDVDKIPKKQMVC
jgi:hypothetical protein